MNKIANTSIAFDIHKRASKKIAAPVYIKVTFDKVRNFGSVVNPSCIPSLSCT